MKNACPVNINAINKIDNKENIDILTKKMSDSISSELYIECSFNSDLNGFHGYNEKKVFELAMKEFKKYCLDLFTKLKNNLDPSFLEVDPSEIWIKINTRDYLSKSDVEDYHERNYYIYQNYDYENQKYSNYGKINRHIIFLSIQHTLPTTKNDYLNLNDMKLLIVLYLYLSQTNNTKKRISTVDDLKQHLPPYYSSIDMVQDELDKLVNYGYIYHDKENNYFVNNLGIYFLKWKQPYSTIKYNM